MVTAHKTPPPSPDICIATRRDHQVSVLTEQHRPDAADVTLHHGEDFHFGRHVDQMDLAVLGAHGH